MASGDRDMIIAAKEEAGLTLLLTNGDGKGLPGNSTGKRISIGHLEIKSKAQNFVKSLVPLAAQPDVSCYGSYEEIYNDPNVDIVYIATPHAFHKQNCLDAIHAGKHVLYEKPFTINARETQIVIDAARKKGVLVMEGM